MALLLCQANGPQWANALKTVCLKQEGVVSSLIVMAQSGCGQVVNSYLIGWW